MKTMPKNKPWWAPGGLVGHILKSKGSWMQDTRGKWQFVPFQSTSPSGIAPIPKYPSALPKEIPTEGEDQFLQNEKFVTALQKSRFASILELAEEGSSGRTLAFVLENIRGKLAREDAKNPYLPEIVTEVARLKSKGSGQLKDEDATIFMTNIAKWMTYDKGAQK